MMFNQYPYINVNDLNLDYILSQIKVMMNEVTNFVSINAIKYADPIQWGITRQYEKNTVVIDPLTGTAYISVAPVPAGVALTRPEYWTVVFDLGSFVTRAAQNFTSHWEQDTTLTATFPSNIGDWLVWGDVLYKVISPIVAGDQYVVDSNIEHFTIEDLYNAYLNTIASILAMIGNLQDLTTSDTSDIVHAINSVLNDLNLTIGDLADLNTTDKTSIVNAVNEVLADVSQEITDRTNADNAILEKIANLGEYSVKDYGAVGDGVTDDTAAIQLTIDTAMENGGGRVVLPTGTYLITSTLIIRPYTAAAHPTDPVDIHFEYMDLIQFVGVGNVIIKAGASMTYMLRTDDFTIGGVGSFSNFYTEISNIKFWGEGIADTGIYIYEMLHGRIYNNRIDGVQDGIVVNGYGQLDVRNNTVRATNRCYMSTSGGDSLIENNDFYCKGENAKGFVLTKWAGSTHINKNNIVPELAAGESNNTIGIQVYNTSGYVSSPFFITHNIFDNVHRAISLYSSVGGEVGGVVIDSNKFVTFTAGGCDAIIMQNIIDSVICNNIVPTPSDSSHKLRLFVEMTSCQKISIHDNVIDGTTDVAIKMYSCIACLVENNHIWDSSNDNDDGYIMIYGASFRNNICNNTLRAVNITSTKGIVEYGTSDYNVAFNNYFQAITTPYIVTGVSTTFKQVIYAYSAPAGSFNNGDICINLTNDAYDKMWIYNNGAWHGMRAYETTGNVRYSAGALQYYDGSTWQNV